MWGLDSSPGISQSGGPVPSLDWHVAVGEEGTVVGGTEEGVGGGGRSSSKSKRRSRSRNSRATVAGDLATSTPAVFRSSVAEKAENDQQWLEEEERRKRRCRDCRGQKSEPSNPTPSVEIDETDIFCLTYCAQILSTIDTGKLEELSQQSTIGPCKYCKY